MNALHRLLGRPLGDVDDSLLNEAVSAKLAETDDLDWKRELPPTRNLSEHDFPKDIAAMANSGGGTLVYGVEEKDKKATGRVDVGELSERHEQTLRSAAVTAISPPVFGLEIVRLGEEGLRAVVVVVPASADGPHVIYRGEYFGAPFRNDANTVWMKEPQIASAYRARLEESRRAADALREHWEEVSANLPIEPRARIILVARPRPPLAPNTKPDSRVVSGYFTRAWQFGKWLTNSRHTVGQHPLDATNNINLRPGLRRWIAMNTAVSSADDWRAAQAAVHDDGSVSLAATIGGPRNGGSGSTFQENQVEARDVECAVADFMGLLLAVSEELPIREYEVQIGMKWIGRPLVVWTFDNRGQLTDALSTPLEVYVPVVRTVTTECADEEFIKQTHDLAEDCINQGGVLGVATIQPEAVWRKDHVNRSE